MKISFFLFFCDFQKYSGVMPASDFHGKQTLRCFTSVENFVNFGPQMPMNDMINEKFVMFAIREKSQIRSLAIRQIGIFLKRKQTGSFFTYDDLAVLAASFTKIFLVVAEIGWPGLPSWTDIRVGIPAVFLCFVLLIHCFWLHVH